MLHRAVYARSAHSISFHVVLLQFATFVAIFRCVVLGPPYGWTYKNTIMDVGWYNTQCNSSRTYTANEVSFVLRLRLPCTYGRIVGHPGPT